LCLKISSEAVKKDKYPSNLRLDVPVIYNRKARGRLVIACFINFSNTSACNLRFARSYEIIRSKFLEDTAAMGYLFWPIKDSASFVEGMKVRYRNILKEHLPNCQPSIYFKDYLISDGSTPLV
jgi:hypothetical protein